MKSTIALLCLILPGLLRSEEAVNTNAPAATNAPAEYRLRSGDLIEVHIYGEDDLTSKVKLSENGNVLLPLLASLKLGDLTMAEAKEAIRKAYMEDYLRNPVVSISIAEYGTSKISVLGQVKAPGIYRFPSNERLNLIQAIALAGGYTRIGEPGKVTIKRIKNGKTSIIHLDAGAMAEKEKTAIFEIQPDDVVSIGETIF